MANLFKAFLFKLRRDLTFRITLFVGLGLSILLTAIYLILDHLVGTGDSSLRFCSGANMFYSSLSPAQNFGIAVPINLVCFTVLEFNQGGIRNKIIAGNSKGKVYLSLLLNGLVFTFLLVLAYVGLSTLLGTIFGGFDINGVIMFSQTGKSNVTYFLKMLGLAIAVYVFITAFAVFFATLLRNIGPCIPIVIVVILMAYLSGSIIAPMAKTLPELQGAAQALKVVNPLYALAASEVDAEGVLSIPDDVFYFGIGNNVVYSLLFGFFGLLIFKKRDIK